MLAAVALLAACGKDENTALEGKWIAHAGVHWDSHHPLDITFTGNTYLWHIGGFSPMKEEGTFTYENDVITLTGKSFWTCEIEWSQGDGSEQKETWVKAEVAFPNHKYKVLSFEGDVMTVETITSDVIDQGVRMIMTRGEAVPAESDLKGTWEGTGENGRIYRISFDGKNFTRWEVYELSGKLSEGGEDVMIKVAIKEAGTWKYGQGELTLTPSQRWNSYILHCDQYASPLYYEASEINTATLEASTWYEINGGLWNSVWGLTKLGDTIYVEIKYTNMDTFVVEKK